VSWHVYPVNDLIEHDTDTDECVCGPVVEPVERDDGSFGWLLRHNTLDGREIRENRQAFADALAGLIDRMAG
jgi:hypothetical protein